MFPSSLFTSTMFPCSLMDFGHVPLFPGTPKQPSIMHHVFSRGISSVQQESTLKNSFKKRLNADLSSSKSTIFHEINLCWLTRNAGINLVMQVSI